MNEINLIDLFKKSIIKNWDKPAFSDYAADRTPVRYADLALRISAIHEIFADCGIETGSKRSIAILGKNSANWATAYLATLLYGAVVVPILPEFKQDEIDHIINHSDAVILFCADDIFKTLSVSKIENVKVVVSLTDFRMLSGKWTGMDMDNPRRIDTLKNEGAAADGRHFNRYVDPGVQSDETLCSIVYTSGTTGFSKGVMLPRRSLRENITFSQENMPLASGDTILSFLPLAHAFGCAFEFLFPFSIGCHITFLDKMPSPTILLKAFSEIKPRLILSVPLIIEKLYNNNIKKIIQGKMSPLLKIPLANRILKSMIRKKLEQVFGGNFIEIIVGGASLSPEVEDFLRDIRFRYTVGYGMTECGPLISYAGWKTFKKYSVGRIVDSLTIRIDSSDPVNMPGEIMVRGSNVMHGYYKNQKDTSAVLSKDGWLGTGDLGTLDPAGNITIRGRKKTMLLGPSGQNIYPEEIEAKLNNLPLIRESIVVQRNQKLTALIFPAFDEMNVQGLNDEDLAKWMEQNRKKVNAMVSSHYSISKIEIVTEEFAKTPSKKIKRYLYS